MEKKVLGFTCDPALKGMHHAAAAVAKAKNKLRTIGPLEFAAGSAHALNYIQTHITPHVLYAAEMIQSTSEKRKLTREWEKAIQC